MKLEFLTSGLRTTTQDSGRPGFTHIGVPVGGALDQAALHYANRLVGNPIYSPVLEITLTGPRIKCLESGQVASAGGDFKLVVNGQARAPNTAITLEAGDELSFEPSSAGCRTFLAVAGNWCVKRWLGSASALRVGSHELLPEAVWYKGNVLETYAFNVTPWPSPLLPPAARSQINPCISRTGVSSVRPHIDSGAIRKIHHCGRSVESHGTAN